MGRKRGLYRTATWNEIELIARRVTADAGTVDLEAVAVDLAAWVENQPGLLAAQNLPRCRTQVHQWDQERRPHGGEGGQFGLFEPQTLIPYERNQRVWLEYATRDQFLAWGRIEQVEYDAEVAAFLSKQRFRDDVVAHWAGTDRVVGDVMAREHGYVRPTVPFWKVVI